MRKGVYTSVHDRPNDKCNEELAERTALEAIWVYGQAIKRIRWMPWQLEAMKDVVGHESLRGAVKHALIRRCPNGETHPACWVSLTEFIG